MSEETIGPITAAYDLYVDLTRRDATIATLTAALREARGALEVFSIAANDWRAGLHDNTGIVTTIKQSCEECAFSLGDLRRARTAIATINAALGRKEP